MRFSDKAWAYALLRVALGVNFGIHGFIRVFTGVGAFAATTAEHMGKSPLPHGFVYGFACLIPWIELVLGLGLMLGLATRAVLVLGSVFLMGLTVGVGMNQQWDVAGQQLVYSVVMAGLLFLVEWNEVSVDGRMRRVRG